MIAAAKLTLPLYIFLAGLFFAFTALSGRVHWALGFLIFILPLRNVIEKLHIFPFGKDLIDIIILCTLIGWILNTVVKNQPFFDKSPINMMCVVLIIWMFMSLMMGNSYLNTHTFLNFGDPRVQSWKNFAVLPILFMLTFNNVTRKKWIWQLLLIMLGTIVLMNLYQVRQLTWYTSIESRTKLKGTFVYLGPNEIAAFYNMYTTMMVAAFLHMKKSWAKIALWWIIFTNINCILFLFSRGAYIGLAIGLFCIFLFKNRILLVPLVLAAIFWQVALPDKVLERINMTTNEYGEFDKSNEGRILIWEQSYQLFKENPIFGAGYGVFRNMGFSLGDTHNIYLKILAEQGIVGLFIFLMLLFLFFSQGMQLYGRAEDNLEKGIGLGFAMSIIVLMVNNMFGDRWTYLQVSTYLWVMAGIVARLNLMAKQVQDEVVKTKKKKEVAKLYAR